MGQFVISLPQDLQCTLLGRGLLSRISVIYSRLSVQKIRKPCLELAAFLFSHVHRGVDIDPKIFTIFKSDNFLGLSQHELRKFCPVKGGGLFVLSFHEI